MLTLKRLEYLCHLLTAEIVPTPAKMASKKKFSHSLRLLNKNVHVGHEEYPHRVASTIDRTSEMLGSVRPYRRQVRVRQYVVYFWSI